MTESIHQITVHYTDRTRANGSFVTRTRQVSVLADSETDAMFLAVGVVSASIPDDFMVVQTDLVL